MRPSAKHPKPKEGEGPPPDKVQWRFIFGFAQRPHLIALVPAVCLSLASGGITPIMTIFVGKFFNTFADYSSNTISPADLMQRASLCLYAFLALGASTVVLQGASCAFWTVFGEMQARRVREELFARLIQRDIGWFEMRERGVGSLLSRLQTYLREFQVATSLPMGNAVSYVVEGSASLAVAFYYSWRLTLVILAAIPFIVLAVRLLSGRIQVHVAGENEALTDGSKISNNAATHISMIKCFNMQTKQLDAYLRSIWIAGRFYKRQIRLLSFQIGLVRFLAIAIFVVGCWYGNVLIHRQTLEVGHVVTTFWSTLTSVQAFEALLPTLIIFEKGRAAAGALLAIISRVNHGDEAVRQGRGLYPNFCEGDIQLSEVSFAYPARPEHNVLQRCSLHFPAKSTSFLLGKSGSGKSTIGNLILGLYPTVHGTIRVDGRDIRYLDQAFLCNNITLVQQTGALFNETLLKNIDPRNEDIASTDSVRINKCVQMAELSSTISALPDGLMTRIGSGGLALSGGQKQRVALCRAFLRNTPVLILDETTSALDNRNKAAVMENIRAWRAGMTTIIATHDTSLIQSDDLVHVMQDGKVIARGKWRDLSPGVSMSEDDTASVRTSIYYPFQLDGTTTYLRAHHMSPTLGTRQVRTRQDSLEECLGAASRACESLALRQSRTTPRSSGFNLHQPCSAAGSDILARASMSDAIIGLASLAEPTRSPPFNQPNRLLVSSDLVTTKPRAAFQPPDKPLPLPPISEAHGDQPLVDTVDASEERDRPSLPVMRILSTALPLLDTTGRCKLAVGLVGTIAQGVIPAGFAFVLTDNFETFYETSWKANALKYSGLLLVIAFGDGAVSFLTRYMLESSAQECCNQVRALAMKKILAQPRAWFDHDTHSSSYLTTTLDRNAEDMRSLVGRLIPLILFGITISAGTVIWAIVLCWKLTLVALGTIPVIYLLTRSSHRVTEHWEAREVTASEQIGDIFDETFTNIKTVRALTLESYFHRKYYLATNEAFSIGLRRGLYGGLLFGLAKSSLNFLLALIFYYSAYLAKVGSFPTSKILHTLTLLVFGTAGMSSVMGSVPQLAAVVNTSSRLLRLAQMPERSHESNGHLRLDKHNPTTLCGPIHFINTTFYYPTRPSGPALKQLNLCLPAHRCTAIVGRSGSGKSTIAALLLGLYPPGVGHHADTAAAPVDRTEGEGAAPSVTLSGRDIRTLELSTLREMVVLVPQTPVIFPTSVRENIICGLETMDALAKQANIERAAIRAGIHDFVMTLPDRYDTAIGDGGLGVSGGQAQRIVLARALVRRPKILILDEPTSALDRESATIVRRSIESLLLASSGGRKEDPRSGGAGMTVIIITHSREMMEFADNVVVMEAGSVVEAGTYHELLAMKRGRLRELLGAGGDGAS